ncbi:MAG: hypothetical protein J2P36_33290 [Ktedonobacteraceae bacterium]|nr:hypothetical protein [Ktedonobacteraceae bacterium]
MPQYVAKSHHPRLSHTPFRSPQLALFDLGPDEWLLYWKAPSYAPARRKRSVPGIMQLPLFDPLPEVKAVGAHEGGSAPASSPLLRLIAPAPEEQR